MIRRVHAAMAKPKSILLHLALTALTVAMGAGCFFDGGGSNKDGGTWDGLIDEVGFWKGRVLSGAERTELYNAGAGRDYAYIIAGAAAGHPTTKRFGGVEFAGVRSSQPCGMRWW